MPHDLGAGAVVFAAGYVVGALPLAAVVLAIRRRRAGPAPVGGPRPGGLPRPIARLIGPTLSLAAEGGIRIVAAVVLLELLKGAVVGVGARAYDTDSWFVLTAIAGCVVGDVLPPARTGRRGVVPLLSGTYAALQGIVATPLVVIPLVALIGFGLRVYALVVAICIPVAFVGGSNDRRAIPAAVLTSAALIAGAARARQRRAALLAAGRRGLGGRRGPGGGRVGPGGGAAPGDPTVIDAPAVRRVPPGD